MRHEMGVSIPQGDLDPFLPTFAGGSAASSTFSVQAANSAKFFAFWVRTNFTVDRIVIDVSTSSGNIDVGLYDGLGNRLVSTGSIASPGSNRQEVSIAQTVLSPRNNPHFFAIAADNTTFTMIHMGTVQPMIRTYRVASSFPLPSVVAITGGSRVTDEYANFVLPNKNHWVA